MSKTPSSVAWLNSKYSRAKGQIARMAERIKGVEARIELHRYKIQRCEDQLVHLGEALAQAEILAQQIAHAMKLHVHAPLCETVGEIRPGEHPSFFKRGGMTVGIFRALKSAPGGAVTIDELQNQLMQALKLAPEDVARFRMRLQTRLQILRRQGKVTSPDHNGVSGKRWMLSKDWVPTPPAIQGKKYSRHRSNGSVQPARWLIQSQRDIAAVKTEAIARGDANLSSKLGDDLDAIDNVWRQHPLHFEIELGWTPSSRASHYRESIYARVSRALTQARQGMTIPALQAACPCPSNKNRQASTRAIEAALRQMLLEGHIEHRQNELDGQVEWRLRPTP
ncbi:hypothetical protein [Thermomonas sp. HDW16]|uniref:hypothetical protein n=1 Tax=Thermomonas sp. HDW16 TaxID=2714945 RepID=UPI00140D6E87|nr:hypothetical protein [Thermomonas sp. HDW16]QIL19635.1 hypothetical protein G7079_02215 [Thermomonas sp. HDW16]